MAEVNHSLLGTLGLIGGGLLAGDYFVNGSHSVLGKLLGHHKHHIKRHVPRWVAKAPVDPFHGERPWDEPSVGHRYPAWVYPVKTARAPFPAMHPDTSGRIKIPVERGGESWQMAREIAAEEIANMVFNDMSFLADKSEVGTSVEIRNNVLAIMNHHDNPELFRRLIEFHHRHGPEALNRGSPLYNQQIELAGACADLYESAIGKEKWFSREGFAYAAEYDDINDRLAASGAKSPIQFNIGGAYYLQ